MTLGVTVSFAVVIATGYFDAWFETASSEAPLQYDQSDEVTPMAAMSFVAKVVATQGDKSVSFGLKDDESGNDLAVTQNDVTIVVGDEVQQGTIEDGKLKFSFTGTRRIRVVCSATIERQGYDPLSFAEAQLDDETISTAPEFYLIVNGTLVLTLYYGSTGTRTTTVGYYSGSDSTMGTVLVDGGTEPVVKNRGQKVYISALPLNGFLFAGWFRSPTAQGLPVSTDKEFTLDVTTDTFWFARFEKDAHSICEWEGSEDAKALVWRSKTYAASKPFNPSACRVDGLGYPPSKLVELTVDMFSAPDVNAKPTASTTLTNIANQNARRLPVRRMERYMQVQIKANVEIDALLVGTSMEGIAL